MRHALASFWSDRKGSPVLEAAVVLPFVLVLGLGAIEFGYVFYQYQIVTMGLRTGARYLARIPQASWQTAVPGDSRGFTYEQYARSLAAIDTASGTPRVAGWSMAAVTVTSRATSNCTTVNGACVKNLRGDTTLYSVTMSTSFAPTGLGFTALIGLAGPLRITAQHEERVIGQ